jgi:hypothetical protein
MHLRSLGAVTAMATADHAATEGAPYVQVVKESSLEIKQILDQRTIEEDPTASSHDARRRLSEKDEQPRSQENRNDRATQLRHELIPRLRAQQVPRLQIRRARGNDTANQIQPLRGLLRDPRALRYAAEDELRRLGDGGHWVDVGVPGGLDADEGEDEAEEQREDRFADVHVELGGEDGAGHDDAEEQADGPP